MEYLGYEVLSDPLLMPSESMPRVINRVGDVLDPGPGAWFPLARSSYPTMTTEHKWKFQNRERAWDFRKWLHRQAGRLNPVWVPSRTHDLIPAQASIDGYEMDVFDVDYRNMGLDAQGMRHMAVISTGGEVFCTRIVDAQISYNGPEYETLSLDPGLTVASIAMVCFLSLHRFEADRISIVWNRPGVGTCNASLVSLGCTSGAGAESPEAPE